ncbi:enoyl-CoA hydratase/isomerase family [Thraustotheca clavata]|uniref:Enoyl-CoA hydratase/isomerase family n=1 Tax=Thraustotheca clavata TaxID=74557 RepID=A0A1V9Z5P6_9STRA|nr:enoyl-CoA hydratase/isomerase family [Thraustotheca clavata]
MLTKFLRVQHRVRSFSTASEFLVERLTGDYEGVALLTMTRPAARNALGKQMMKEMRAAMDSMRFDTSVRVVVVQSTVPRVFCAGADLKERMAMTPEEVAATVYGLRSAFTELEQLPMPTIAAIEGAALGGGLEMALACDFRIAGAKALLGTPETGLAILPGAGGTQRLPRLIGLSKAKELIFTSRKIDSITAERIGLVDYAVDENEALPKALELAKEILPNGPIGVRMAKEAITKGIQVDQTSGMAIERACYAQTIPTKDRLEGLQAFREKRKPVYKGE